MTKQQLEKENKELKDIIRDLKSQLNATKQSMEGLGNLAFGVTHGESGYNLVSLCFDVEKNRSAIKDVIYSSKNVSDFAIKSRNKLVDEILRIEKNRNKNLTTNQGA